MGDGKLETGDRFIKQKIGKFEDLKVWKEGMRLTVNIYRAVHACHDWVRVLTFVFA